jgi:tRNA G18 (ribose-2'-O)-methylase SpoU
MFHVHKVDNLDLPELAPYRTMKRPVEHCTQGIFVAEGEKLLRRMLESRFEVVSALMPERWLPSFEPLLQARPENVPVYLVDKKQVLESLIGFSMFQGVMGVGKIPKRATLEALLGIKKQQRLFVAADALSNAENIGVLVRNAAAFDADGFLVGETSSSPYLRRAVRNSMGTIFQLPIVEPPSLVEALKTLRTNGIQCVAAHPHASGKTLWQADLKQDCCIVFGSEGHGIRPEVLGVCDEAVAIPMPPTVDSLNVGSASAAFLYEVMRQRQIS